MGKFLTLLSPVLVKEEIALQFLYNENLKTISFSHYFAVPQEMQWSALRGLWNVFQSISLLFSFPTKNIRKPYVFMQGVQKDQLHEMGLENF